MKWDKANKRRLYDALQNWRWEAGTLSPKDPLELYEKFDIRLNGLYGFYSKKCVIIDSPFVYTEKLSIPKDIAEKFLVLGIP